MDKRIPISVIIHTLNEEVNLPKCLDKLKAFDEIWIVDQGSKDSTVKIASDYGCNIVDYSEIENLTEARRKAATELSFRNEWLLVVDADEEVSSELADELKSIVASPSKHSCYSVRWKTIFLGRWVRHIGSSVWHPRLFNIHISRPVFEKRATNAKLLMNNPGKLKNRLIHNDASPIDRLLLKVVLRFSKGEAYAIGHRENVRLTSTTKREKLRRHLKKIHQLLPLRGPRMFVYLYIFRLGFLDGYPGYVFCKIKAFSNFLIGLRLYMDRRGLEEIDISKIYGKHYGN